MDRFSRSGYREHLSPGPVPSQTGPVPDLRRRELALFLRSRRERLAPEDVGMARPGPRRTPGLRREEVAALADVGVTWYTWLEQGRPINASPQVLCAVARALRLQPDERAHLLRLAGHPPPVRPGAPGPVTEEHRQLLDALLPLPACVQTSRFDVLAYNRSYRYMINDIERFPEADRNCAVLVFLDPRWRASYLDWDRVSAGVVARLRSSMAAHLDDPEWTSLVRRLRTESAEFRELWSRREVRDTDDEPKCFHNPEVGLLRTRFARLRVDRAPEASLVGITPLDERTRARLVELDRAHEGEPRVRVRAGAAARDEGPAPAMAG